MRRSKKFIIAGVLAAVLLVGSVGGIALAQTGDEEDTQPQTLMARVADILGIDQQTLEDAFAQAKSEMRDEALDNYLNGLVEEGTITQDEADQYRSWWQARPDMEPFRQQLREWGEARPNVPLPERTGGRCFPGGMKRGGGFHFWGR